MENPDRPARRIAGGLLCVLLAALPTALVLLHAGSPTGSAHVESSHDPDRCRVLHDHELCVVFGANPPTPGEASARPGFGSDVRRGTNVPRTLRPPAAGETATRRPRAPPLLPV